MPKIKLTEGSYRYKSVPIFEGVKRINKQIAFNNLCQLKNVLDKHGIEFQLTFGTLLGAIREGDFIDHDEDIDLLIFGENKQQFFDILPELREKGFEVARYDRRNLMSIIKDGEYIDLYFMSLRENGTRYCSGIILPTELTDETIEYSFKGLEMKIPKAYLQFLRYEYGDNWMIPIQWFNYEPSKIARSMTVMKSILKEWLPDFMFFLFVKPSEHKMLNRYLPKLERFRKEQVEVKED